MARPNRPDRRAQRLSPDTTHGAPYIKRGIPYVNYLEEDGLQALENQADWIIQEIGMEFREDEIALQLWRDAGADVKGTRVRLPRGMARDLCKTIPKSFIQHSINPARNIVIGGDHSVFAPVYGAPFVRDLQNGRRYGSMADLEKLVKLTYMLEHLHHSGFVTCEPCDVPVNKRHLDTLYTHMTCSDKPMLGAITEKSRAEDSVAMARILFGAEFLEDHCVIMGNVNTNSPLLVDKVVTEAIRTYNGANQGIIVSPFILGGAMGPVTTAASIAQSLAEAMVCGAFTQLVRAGSPFILGNFLSSMSLRSGAPTFGMPEPVASHYVIGQLARRLGVPLRSGGSLSASKLPDAQAAAESADSMHSTAMGGTNFVLQAAGWLEGGLVCSYEKLILDADRLGGYAKLLGGMPLDDNALGKSAYDDVEPSGHFLGSAHTMANYETAYYEATMSDNNSYEQWVEHGEKDSAKRAYERWNAMLKTYSPPSLDIAKRDELKDFIDRKKSMVADAWY